MKADELSALAESVTDGSAVDWDTAERTADPQHVSIIRHLRLVASIADVHRTHHTAHDDHAALQPVPEAEPGGARLGRWGRLDLLEVIGRGAHGIVYKAFDPQLRRIVALKLRPTGDGAHGAAALVSEARLLARVRHPGVVSVYGAAVEENVVGIWMEHVEGETLSELVEGDRLFGASEAAVVGMSLCRALAAVHHAGLLHRDVKAANVMRERGGRIVLMDFGAGLESDDVGATRSGTPLYLAPEILAGGRASVPSDLYALAVLLFHLVTGRFPVEGRSIDELKARHAAGGITRLRDLRPDLPEPFVRAINRCLEPNPDRRFVTAGEFENALELPSARVSRPILRRLARSKVAWGMGTTVAAGALLALIVDRPDAPPPRDGPEGPAIVVMPFANRTGDPALAYVAEGFTDLLLTNLVRYDGLRVQSRAASARVSPDDWHDTAERLRADYVVTGSVIRAGAGLSSSIQLIESSTGRTVWALDDKLGSEDYLRRPVVVAGLLAREIGVPAKPFESQISSAVDAAAQDAYFRGLGEANTGVPSRSASALQYFREAVERAPDFAEAWAALALQHIARGNSGPASDRGAHYAQARSAAFAALERNPRLGEAHTALGTLAFYFDWDWEAADRSFRQALEYAPGDAFAYQRYSMFLAALGRLDEAIDAARLSQAIEPMVPTRSSSLGTIYYYARRYEEAAAEMQRALDLSPRFATAEYGLGRIRASQGRFDEAITHLTRAAELGSPVSAFLEVARVHALHGDAERSAAAIQKLGALQPLPDITPDNLAFVDAARGDLDTAFARLDAALTLRAGNLLWIRVDPRFDPLRNDPRFESLVRRLQFP